MERSTLFAVQPFILDETTYVVLTDGRYEIAVQSDKLQVNGRNADDTASETIVVFQRPEAGGNMGFGFKKAKDFKEFGGGQGVIVIANAAVAPSPSKKLAGAGMLYVENGGAHVYGFEWHSDRSRAGLGCDQFRSGGER